MVVAYILQQMTPINTHSIPDLFLSPVSIGGGCVQSIPYQMTNPDNLQKTTKSAFVYFPHGFSPNQDWDVLYLIHGWTENNSYFLNDKNCVLKTLLDNLIVQNVCRPFIVVSPTWDIDNEEKDWEVSCKEIIVTFNFN